MSKTIDDVMSEVFASPVKLADVTGAADPMARAIEIARASGVSATASEITAALQRRENLPDEVLVLAAGGGGTLKSGSCG